MGKLEDYRFSFRSKDGGTQIILSYKDAAGRWRQKSKQGFKNEKEAKRVKDELLDAARKECERTSDLTLASINLLNFFDNYFSRDLHNQITYNTLRSYRHAIMTFFPDGKPIKDITPADISIRLSDLEKDYKPVTVKAYYMAIKRVLRHAQYPYRVITTLPFTHIKFREAKKRKRKVRAMTNDELESFLQKMKPHQDFYTMACIGAFAGLRIGEVLGLTWDDIDLQAKTLSVRRQFARTGERESGIKDLKTANSYRTIPIPSRLVAIIQDWERISGDSTFLFSRISFTSYYKCFIKNAPGFSSHSLRHTFATTLLHNGADVKTVAILLGDTVGTVMNTYLNYTDDMRKSAANLVENIFKR